MSENNNVREKRIGFLRRTAKEVRTYNVRMRIMGALLILLLLLAIILYIVAALYHHSGSFTVKVDKIQMTKYGLALSESRNMTYQSSHLNVKIDKEMTNIAKEWLPDNLDQIDGEHNGDNYIAYTFYLQNAGEIEVAYEYTVTISNISHGLDEAIRISLYVDGEETTYAKTRSDGKGAEYGTTEFHSANIVAKNKIESFNAGDITKYTVVIWIEGNDPDCVDQLIGGKLKVDMMMQVVL